MITSYCSALNDIKTKLTDFFEINKHYRKATNEEVQFINDTAYVTVFMHFV